MIYVVLIISGIVIVIFSVFSINKRVEKEKNIYEEIIRLHEEIKNYVGITEEILENLEDLIDDGFYKLNKTLDLQQNVSASKDISLEDRDKKSNAIFADLREGDGEKKNDITDITNEIINLKSCGYSVEEIAKKLNKGKREVEIILKLHKKT